MKKYSQTVTIPHQNLSNVYITITLNCEPASHHYSIPSENTYTHPIPSHLFQNVTHPPLLPHLLPLHRPPHLPKRHLPLPLRPAHLPPQRRPQPPPPNLPQRNLPRRTPKWRSADITLPLLHRLVLHRHPIPSDPPPAPGQRCPRWSERQDLEDPGVCHLAG